MEEVKNNQLTVADENGNPQVINVVDILGDNKFNKEFIIYTLEGDEDTIFASILTEDDVSFSLDALESDDQIDFVNQYIDDYVNSQE